MERVELSLETRTEEELVLEWRTLRLVDAGLPDLAASSVASTPVDIEYAVSVVRRVLAAEKPYELAVNILL